MKWIGSLGEFTICRFIEAIICTTKSYLEIGEVKTLVDVTFFCLNSPKNRRVLRDCTLADLDFRIPYCPVDIPYNSSA